jgi:hypothetical protein
VEIETEAPRRARRTLDAIALRVVQGFGAERAFIVGGSGAGKSTAIEVLTDKVLADYPTAPCLLLDTKPRFRAEWELNGAPAAHRYRKWDRGAFVPGSVVLDYRERDYGMPMARDLGHRIWIFQDDREAARPLMLHAVERFFEGASGPRKPRLLVVDETLDFFLRNGYPVKGTNSDSLLRVARAGRERGVLAIFGSQRSVGIPPQLLVEATKVFLFRLDKESDIKVIIENGGMPEGIHSPERDHEFYYYDKRRRFLGFYKLRLPERAA